MRQRGNVIDTLRDALEINGQLNVSRDLPRLHDLATEQIQKVQINAFMIADTKPRRNTKSVIRLWQETLTIHRERHTN